MKKILLPIFILAYATVNAQTVITISDMKTIPWVDPRPPHMKGKINVILLSNGDTLQIGQILKLGKGSLPNGDFNYIATPSNTSMAKLKRATTLKEIKIIELNRKGSEKYGYRYYIKVEGGFLVQFEDALATGEIIYEPIKKL